MGISWRSTPRRARCCGAASSSAPGSSACPPPTRSMASNMSPSGQVGVAPARSGAGRWPRIPPSPRFRKADTSMSLPWSNGARNAQFAACILGAVLVHRAGAAPVLTVCIDQASPTSVMDARVARAAARTQGYTVKLVAFVGYGRGGDVLPLGRFAKMAQSECQLVMGFPVDVSAPNLPPDVEATSAYASTGFVLVRRGASKTVSLSELPQGSEVGIAQLDTYAGLLYGTHPNIVMHVYPKDSLMLADLEAKRIAAGLAWQPSIEFYSHRHPVHPSLSIRLLPGKHMLWNLVALLRPQSQSAADVFDKGLEELRSRGQLA